MAKVIDESGIYEFYYDGELVEPVEGPLRIETQNLLGTELTATHTYDEAEKLLYEYLGGVSGFEGLKVRQISPADYSGIQFEMTISGGGAPIYITQWYIVNLETGEVTIADKGSYVCDLW